MYFIHKHTHTHTHRKQVEYLKRLGALENFKNIASKNIFVALIITLVLNGFSISF